MSTDYEVVAGDDARAEPRRLLVVQEDERPAVHADDEDFVMTVPHLMVRELIAFVGLSLFLVALALLFDAPLEELANPQKTPNPSKAPWYFLGLQELLHYYSPLISGVIIPSVLIGALIVIPYFNINVERAPFWREASGAKMIGVIGVTVGLTALFMFTAAHPVWSLIATTWLIAVLIVLPRLLGGRTGVLHWLETRSLPFWIFTWFVVATVVLTVIGVFFRGPGWTFTLPWRDGIF